MKCFGHNNSSNKKEPKKQQNKENLLKKKKEKYLSLVYKTKKLFDVIFILPSRFTLAPITEAHITNI